MQLSNYGRPVNIRVLGPIGVRDGDEWLPLGGPKQRLVLAALVAARGRVMSTSALIDALWPEDPPASARKTLQGYVHHLRSVLGDRLTTESSGYRLDTTDWSVDADSFATRVESARALLDTDPARASELLTTALGIWEGNAYSDLELEPALMAPITELEEARLHALEDRIEADLRSGSHEAVIGELVALTREHPFRERFWGQLMLALYRSGRHGDALRTYEQARRAMVDELGIDPSAELQDLERRILQNDPDLAGTAPAASTTPRAIRGYELRDTLRHSADVTTHRGYQRSVGREVMIHAITGPHVDRSEFIARFEDDAERLGRIDHPNVLYVVDTWREPGAAHIVLRWVDGTPLSALITDERPTIATITKIADQVGGALSAAHRGGVSHGRIDLDSVLVTRSGDAYLTGFGIGEDRMSGANVADIADFAALVEGLLPNDSPARAALSHATAGGLTSADQVARVLHEAVGSSTPSTEDPARTDLRNPYKGLRAFQLADAGDFYGRGDVVDRLEDMLATRRLVAVVGPSGSGKSSVVRAGLATRLAADAPGRYLIAQMFPGAFPFEELADAIQRVAVGRDASVDELLAGERGLARVLKSSLPTDESEFVLVIDQFEELFSNVENEERRRLFLDSLVHALDDPRSRLRVVITMRADFFDRPLAYPAFGELVQQGLVALTLPDEHGLRDAIVQPAESVGLAIEDGLVPLILRDLGTEPGALPLLQYALTELFENRTGDRLTLAAYHDSGGVVSALGHRAEALYESLSEGGRGAFRHAVLRLVTVDEGAGDLRRRATLAELNALEVDRRSLDTALATFGENRLLTFDRDPQSRAPTVEIAHEALVRSWPRLREWVDQHRDDLELRRRLMTAIGEWEDGDHDATYLLRDRRLDQFEDWAESTGIGLSGDERDFLEQSRRVQQRRERSGTRRRRAAVAVLAVAAVLAASFAVVAASQAREARDQRDAAALAATLAEAREYAAAAARAQDERPTLAVTLAARSVELFRAAGETSGGPGYSALVNAVALAPRTHRIAAASTRDAALTPDGVTLAVLGSLVSDPNTLHLHNLNDDSTATMEFDRSITGVAAIGGGRLVTTHREEPRLTVIDLPTGSRVPMNVPVDHPIIEPRFHNDTDTLVVRSPLPPYELTAIDVGSGAVVADAVTGDALPTMNRDGTVVAWVDSDRRAVRFVDAGTEVIVPTASRVSDAEVAPDGSLVAISAASDDETGSVQAVGPDGAVRWSTPVRFVDAIAWSPDGALLAVAAIPGFVHLLDGKTGKLIWSLSVFDEAIGGIRFNPSGTSIIAVSPRSVAVITLPSGGDTVSDIPMDRASVDARYISDDVLATRGADGSVQRWTTGGELLATALFDPMPGLAFMAVAPDAGLLGINAGADWAIIDGTTLEPLDSGSGAIVGMSRDGRHVVIHEPDVIGGVPAPGELSLLDRTSDTAQALTSQLGQLGAIPRADFSIDDAYVAVTTPMWR